MSKLRRARKNALDLVPTPNLGAETRVRTQMKKVCSRGAYSRATHNSAQTAQTNFSNEDFIFTDQIKRAYFFPTITEHLTVQLNGARPVNSLLQAE